MKNSQISQKLVSRLTTGEILSLTNIFENPHIQEIIMQKKKFILRKVYNFLLFFCLFLFFGVGIGVTISAYFGWNLKIYIESFVHLWWIFFIFFPIFLVLYVKFLSNATEDDEDYIFWKFLWILKNTILFSWEKSDFNEELNKLKDIKFLQDFSYIREKSDFCSFTEDKLNSNISYIHTQKSWWKNNITVEVLYLVHLKLPKTLTSSVIRIMQPSKWFTLDIIYLSIMLLIVIFWAFYIIELTFLCFIVWIWLMDSVMKKVLDNQQKGLIRIEKHKFSQFFDFFSKDKQNAERLLDDNLCQILLQFQEKIGKKCEFLFLWDKIFVKIHTNHRIFDLSMNNPKNIDTYANAYIFLRDLQNFVTEIQRHFQKIV